MHDLDKREWSALLPLVAIVIWLGVYPKPILAPINKGVENTLSVMVSRAITPEAQSFLGADLLLESLQENAPNTENLEILEDSKQIEESSKAQGEENNNAAQESLQEEGE